MSNFLKYVNPAEAKEQEVEDLKLERDSLKSQLALANSRLVQAQAVAVEAEEECPECDDIEALEVICNHANYDVMDVQGVINQETKPGAIWYRNLCAKGLLEEAKLVNDIMCGTLAEREYQLAIAAHNVAFCKAENAPEYVQEKIDELQALVDANPDLDKRCASYINEILAKACV